MMARRGRPILVVLMLVTEDRPRPARKAKYNSDDDDEEDQEEEDSMDEADRAYAKVSLFVCSLLSSCLQAHPVEEVVVSSISFAVV